MEPVRFGVRSVWEVIGGVRGSGHSAEVFDMGAHVRRLWEVDQFRFRKGFDGDFKFEQDREVSVSVQVVAGESWSEHHGCSLPGTPMSFSE